MKLYYTICSFGAMALGMHYVVQKDWQNAAILYGFMVFMLLSGITYAINNKKS